MVPLSVTRLRLKNPGTASGSNAARKTAGIYEKILTRFSGKYHPPSSFPGYCVLLFSVVCQRFEEGPFLVKIIAGPRRREPRSTISQHVS
jgi:hypothetical protein